LLVLSDSLYLSNSRQALAAGTFIYIGTIELLAHEFGTSNPKEAPIKVASVIIGFAGMAVLALWA